MSFYYEEGFGMGDKTQCNHDYRVLTHSIDTIEYRADNEVKHTKEEGTVLFHCTKCLDIQKKVIT